MTAGRRGGQPSKGSPAEPARRQQQAQATGRQTHFCIEGSWRSKAEREYPTHTSHPSSRSILLLHRPVFGSNLPTMGCPWAPSGEAPQSLQAQAGSDMEVSATCPPSSATSHGEMPPPCSISCCPARRCHQDGPSGCHLTQATASWRGYAFLSEQTHTLHIRGKRFYYPTDFS